MNHASQAGQSARQFVTAGTPPTLSQVQSAQSNLDSNIAALHEALSTLEGRLQPVLGPLPTEAGAKTGQIKPVASTVSQHIMESTDSVSYAIGRVTSLLDRLEV